MIKERHMKQAKQADDGEIVQGKSIIIMENGDAFLLPKGNGIAYPKNSINPMPFYGDFVKIDPETVEDVAVKPNIEYSEINCGTKEQPIPQKIMVKCECPNCKDKLSHFALPLYCRNCGQRIDRSEFCDT